MKIRRSFAPTIFAALLMVGLSSAAFGQSDGSLANVYSGGSNVRFDVVAPNGGVTLTIIAPDGRSFTKDYRAGTSPDFHLNDKSLPDGTYTYELRLRPALTAGQRESLKSARGNDDDSEAERGARKPAA